MNIFQNVFANYNHKSFSMSHDIHSFSYREKVMDLGQAIFYIYDESGNKVPVSLIKTLRVDEEGDIWFTINRLPFQTDSSYYSGDLCYYKKGSPYYITVCGTAVISGTSPLLLKFVVTGFEYITHEKDSMSDYLSKLPLIKYLTPAHYQQRDLKMV